MIFVSEVFLSGCISKVISDGVDYSKDKIKNALNNKNDHSLSTKIYRVIEKTLNIVTCKRFKNTDALYDAIERIFNDFKNNGNTKDAVKCGLRLLGSDASTERCENFIEKFHEQICKDKELEKRIGLVLQEKGIEISQEGLHKIYKKLENLDEKISSININEFDSHIRESIKSRTQEYADKWNENMFLNNFNEWDENAGVNVKLCDVYIDAHLPHFIWGGNAKKSENLKEYLSKYIMEKYENNENNEKDKKNKNKMLLILGQPGIGKSTLITWIIANFRNIRDDILVFRFASDLKSIVWQNNLLGQIAVAINLSYKALEGKILILDGYDEMNIDKRGEVLNKLYVELVNEEKVKKLYIIITCRENYANNLQELKCEYIKLQTWSEKQIISFCEVWQLKTKSVISKRKINKAISKCKVFGIPIILYMILSLNVSIDKENDLVDLYDQIFSLDGGIYDRCIAKIEYEYSHRIGDFKLQIHEVSKKTAIWILENNSEEAIIPEDEYKNICQSVIGKEQCLQEFDSRDFMIGNYFKYYIGEGTGQIYFAHRTMYEYFVVEAIYEPIESAIKELSEKSQEILAGNIAFYLKEAQLNGTLISYLIRKISNLYNKLSNDKRCQFYNWWEGAIDKMMENGMFYYTDEKMSNYRNIMTKEANCFLNITEILRKIAFYITPRRYIMENVNSGRLERYIRHCCLEFEKCDFSFFYLAGIELSGIDLGQMNFIGANLNEIDLQYENLRGALLQRANLEGTNLDGTDLQGADLQDATLKFSSLVSANLCKANLSGANLFQADLRHANLRDAILIDAELEATKWCVDELIRLQKQLEQAKFSYVIVEDCITTKIYRNELFPKENKEDFN